MECFQRRSSSAVPRKLLSFLLPCFLPVFRTQHPPIALCLRLLPPAAKSVMVTALPCLLVEIQRGAPGQLTLTLWCLESWGATLSSTPGRLTSPLGPDGVTTLFRSPFSDEHTRLAALNDFLLLQKTQSSNVLCIIQCLV